MKISFELTDQQFKELVVKQIKATKKMSITEDQVTIKCETDDDNTLKVIKVEINS